MSSPKRTMLRNSRIGTRILLPVLAFLIYGYGSGARLAFAVGANPEPFQLQQPGGAPFMARAWGDEWNNGMETLNGYTIAMEPQSGRWAYATRNAVGQLVPSQNFVGDGLPAGLQPSLRPLQQGPPAQSPLVGPVSVPPLAPPTGGNQPLLVIVVDFTPSQSLLTTETHWNQYFFSGGSTYAPTSVKNYWDTVSYGAITIQPATETYGTNNDGVVFITLPGAHPDPGGATGDSNRQITVDALTAADSFVNYASFDTNPADGYLNTNELHIYIIVRGYENSFGGASVCAGQGKVWAHKWSLFGAVAPPTLDSTVVGYFLGAPSPGAFQGGYMQQGEWFCAGATSHEPTIGVAAHEMGHDLGTGVPDLYDTNTGLGTDSEGIGRWGVQGGGSWNGGGISGASGTHPAFPDPWSRWLLGFLTPIEITTSQAVALPQIETATGGNRGVFQLLSNPGGVDWVGTGEYFLVENRQQTGYDADLPGHGLLIWHIDESASSNADEGSSPPGNKRIVTVEQADGRYDLACYENPPHASLCNGGDGTDSWKSTTFTTFNNSSTPSSKLWDGSPSGVAVTGVSASSANMSATLNPTDAKRRRGQLVSD